MRQHKSQSVSGGCQCGAVRYRVRSALGQAVACHCRMCQKAFGSWGAVLVDADADSLIWTRGAPSIFRSSSIVARGFCRDCGTPLFMREDGDSHYELAVGSLDDPSKIKLVRQSGTESRLDWLKHLAQLPEETTSDYRSPEDLKLLKSLQHPDHDTKEWPPKTSA
jgi:hypothetical protein